MKPGRPLLAVERGARFEQRFRALDPTRRGSCARAIEALIRQQPTPGMRVKPILPDKRYAEARLGSGDRLIFRVADGVLYLLDIVTHDEIARYSRRRNELG